MFEAMNELAAERMQRHDLIQHADEEEEDEMEEDEYEVFEYFQINILLLLDNSNSYTCRTCLIM